jgi:hypothetical protein
MVNSTALPGRRPGDQRRAFSCARGGCAIVAVLGNNASSNAATQPSPQQRPIRRARTAHPPQPSAREEPLSKCPRNWRSGACTASPSHLHHVAVLLSTFRHPRHPDFFATNTDAPSRMSSNSQVEYGLSASKHWVALASAQSGPQGRCKLRRCPLVMALCAPAGRRCYPKISHRILGSTGVSAGGGPQGRRRECTAVGVALARWRAPPARRPVLPSQFRERLETLGRAGLRAGRGPQGRRCGSCRRCSLAARFARHRQGRRCYPIRFICALGISTVWRGQIVLQNLAAQQ